MPEPSRFGTPPTEDADAKEGFESPSQPKGKAKPKAKPNSETKSSRELCNDKLFEKLGGDSQEVTLIMVQGRSKGDTTTGSLCSHALEFG